MIELARVLKAFILAAPWCLMPRFRDTPGHCVPASLAGSIALRSHDLTAEAVPCAVLAYSKEGTLCNMLGVGRTPREVYTTLKRFRVDGLPNLETFMHDPIFEASPEGSPLHMVIRAERQNEHGIVDLTSGQLTNDLIRVPAWQIRWAQTWGVVPLPDGGHLIYGEHDDPEAALRSAALYPQADLEFLADDIVQLMRLAFEQDCNARAFHQVASKRRLQALPEGAHRGASLWIA